MSALWNFDPDLDRSRGPIVGFDVSATDGAVGTVASTVDDEDTAFLVVERGHLLATKHVVIPRHSPCRSTPMRTRARGQGPHGARRSDAGPIRAHDDL